MDGDQGCLLIFFFGRHARNRPGNEGAPSFLFIIFGTLVFTASCINLLITIGYQYRKSREYLGMLKAIGLTDEDIFKITLFQIGIDFVKSVGIAILFSFLVCLSGTISYNLLIAKISGISYYSLNFGYYFMILFITLIFLVLLAYLTTYFCCRKDQKKEVIVLLKNK